MPTYEYACGACGHEWEQTQRITEPPIEVCPACAKTTAHRLISGGTNFILKGSGWYSDLYSSPKPSTDKAEKKSEGSDANAKTSSEKSDKPADKSSTQPAAPAAASPKPSSPPTPASS